MFVARCSLFSICRRVVGVRYAKVQREPLLSRVILAAFGLNEERTLFFSPEGRHKTCRGRQAPVRVSVKRSSARSKGAQAHLPTTPTPREGREERAGSARQRHPTSFRTWLPSPPGYTAELRPKSSREARKNRTWLPSPPGFAGGEGPGVRGLSRLVRARATAPSCHIPDPSARRIRHRPKRLHAMIGWGVGSNRPQPPKATRTGQTQQKTLPGPESPTLPQGGRAVPKLLVCRGLRRPAAVCPPSAGSGRG